MFFTNWKVLLIYAQTIKCFFYIIHKLENVFDAIHKLKNVF